MQNIMVKVEEICEEAEGIRTFKLTAKDGGQLQEFQPGSHIDVRITADITRQYSLCGPQGKPDHYLIAVKRNTDSRGGSKAMFQGIGAGGTLAISAPRSNFELDDSAGHKILFAGGIGITPIISMADRLHDTRASFELHYFSRALDQTAFHKRLSQAAYSSKVHFHHALNPEDTAKRLGELLFERPPRGQIYLCGPKPFMDLVEATAAHSWPEDSINLEYFSVNSGVLAGESSDFQVTLSRSGGTYSVPGDQSIIDVLYDNGVDVNYSCEQGICGTCLTRVLDGVPDHRDSFLSQKQKDANDRMCLCVSRAKFGTLVLDI